MPEEQVEGSDEVHHEDEERPEAEVRSAEARLVEAHSVVDEALPEVAEAFQADVVVLREAEDSAEVVAEVKSRCLSPLPCLYFNAWYWRFGGIPIMTT